MVDPDGRRSEVKAPEIRKPWTLDLDTVETTPIVFDGTLAEFLTVWSPDLHQQV
ncbi:hypothetical protein ACFLSJ_03700 [Verrucomicrobiota bacterium]